ncbi:HAMP domain-containing sensor histidine kinase [Cytobacillus purgationiresistens]|uniref:histidine kinase n=1 Tax=Cytobacillus purgationiresistens TaxID=863449 RepID=A0ABU0ANM8_9BACI|nr:HAMP domain-containing sensor histidine kinase [Cytobacillus purgationiresistens]MDQ0272867.1 signal transduction histidine kinase [Cytobacillus purgationiresistens]
MPTKNKKRVSLLRYWTTRYLITLCIGLIVIALVSAAWIRHTTLENRLNIMTLMAEEVADRFVDVSEGKPVPNGDVPGLLDDRGRFMNLENDPSIYIVDTYGTSLFSNKPKENRFVQFSSSILNNEEKVQKLKMEGNSSDLYVIKTPIKSQNMLLGWVVIMEFKDNLTQVNQEYSLLAIMIISLALLGWAAIYFLSKRLSNPIQDVAVAAKKVQEGDYNIDLPDQIKEQEVYELVHSFKEMSSRLEKLESLRTELLAGVTHELKTPVTSISGLLQAVNDDVVTGQEAKEFLQMSLKETTKMKKMVEDLLAFNTFATNAFPVQLETYEINELLRETIYQWNITQEGAEIEVSIHTQQEESFAHVDQIRLQQILTNLLNNAAHAMDGKGAIDVTTKAIANQVIIDIKDSGQGIPKEEQPFIFERFFRGEGKKYNTRGLGLGLPFSKMIAQSLGGDLQLIETSSSGTTFRITILKPS